MSAGQEGLCCWAVVCFLFLAPHSGNSRLVGLRAVVLGRQGQGQPHWDRQRLGKGLWIGHWGPRVWESRDLSEG